MTAPYQGSAPPSGDSFIPAVDQATAGYLTPADAVILAAARAGFTVVDLAAHHVGAMLAGHGRRVLDTVAEHHTVRIGQMSCGTGVPADLTVGSDAWPGALAAWQRNCELAADIGCPVLAVFVPRPRRQGIRIGSGLLAERLAELCQGAADRHLNVTVEIHDPAHQEAVAAIREQAGAANLGLLIDTATLGASHPDPVGYLKGLPSGAVGWVQIADLAHLPKDPPDGRPSKVLPGRGVLDLAAMLAALRDGDYRGPVAVEVPAPAAVAGWPAHYLAAARACLRTPALAGFFGEGRP